MCLNFEDLLLDIMLKYIYIELRDEHIDKLWYAANEANRNQWEFSLAKRVLRNLAFYVTSKNDPLEYWILNKIRS